MILGKKKFMDMLGKILLSGGSAKTSRTEKFDFLRSTFNVFFFLKAYVKISYL